jgi:hypothetical protein
MIKITKTDLLATLEDDRHLGFGFAESQYLPAREADRVARLVAAEMTAQGWTLEDAFAWSNSKYGRWLSDEWHGPRKSTDEARAVVSRYVNPQTLAVLQAGA